MAPEFTVAIGTFGDRAWSDLARSRAVPSALDLRVPVVHVHADTLHDARNQALELVPTEFVCFLDADDELERGYFDRIRESTADIRVPSVRYEHVGGVRIPQIPQVVNHNHVCDGDCLAYGNWLVIGAVAPVALLKKVGGFRDWPVYEDWDVWARCWQAGATIEAAPKAVYRAYVRRDSRNRKSLTQTEKHRVHQDIARDLGLPVP